MEPFGILIEFDQRLFFISLCLFKFLLVLVFHLFIQSGTAVFEVLQDSGDAGVLYLINSLDYLSIPVFYLFKFLVVATLLWIGAFFLGYRLNFAKAWHAAMVSEVIFLGVDIAKIVWFSVGNTSPTYWDLSHFYPLSILSLLDAEMISGRWIFPLKTISVFEILYWALLSVNVTLLIKKTLKQGLSVVFSSYVLGLLLYLIFRVITFE